MARERAEPYPHRLWEIEPCPGRPPGPFKTSSILVCRALSYFSWPDRSESMGEGGLHRAHWQFREIPPVQPEAMVCQLSDSTTGPTAPTPDSETAVEPCERNVALAS